MRSDVKRLIYSIKSLFMYVYRNLYSNFTVTQGFDRHVALPPLARLVLCLQSIELCTAYTDPSSLKETPAEHLRVLWTNVTQAVR